MSPPGGISPEFPKPPPRILRQPGNLDNLDNLYDLDDLDDEALEAAYSPSSN